MSKPSDIMSEIDATRADIRATLDEIQGRMKVDRIVQEVVGPNKSSVLGVGKALGAAARDNPLALGVTAVGLGWLMLGSRGNHTNGSAAGAVGLVSGSERLDPNRPPEAAIPMPDLSASGEQSGSEASATIGAKVEELGQTGAAVADEVKDWAKVRAQEAKTWARESVSEFSATVRDSAEDVKKAVRAAAGRAESRVRQEGERARGYVRQHPMSVSLLAAAAGAAMGFLLMSKSQARAGADRPLSARSGKLPASPSGTPSTEAEPASDPIPLMTTEGEYIPESESSALGARRDLRTDARSDVEAAG